MSCTRARHGQSATKGRISRSTDLDSKHTIYGKARVLTAGLKFSLNLTLRILTTKSILRKAISRRLPFIYSILATLSI